MSERISFKQSHSSKLCVFVKAQTYKNYFFGNYYKQFRKETVIIMNIKSLNLRF